MKFATYRRGGQTAVGVVKPDEGMVWPVEAMLGAPVADLVDLIGKHPDATSLPAPTGPGIPLREVQLLAPIPRPRRNVFCVGKNYHEHAHEFTRSGFDSSASNASDAIPKFPIFFTKVPETVIGPDAPIRYPTGVSEQLDYEVELAVIIGVGGRDITREAAYGHVWGYTIINDVTARDLQARHKQWFLGKSLDTFCPMGPWVVTADEVDPANLEVRCWVNDELRQNANTRDLIFDIPTLIQTASAGITLLPGDIIATGTPAGVGIGFDPPRFLQPGDRVTLEISGIGRLSNPIE